MWGQKGEKGQREKARTRERERERTREGRGREAGESKSGARVSERELGREREH